MRILNRYSAKKNIVLSMAFFHDLMEHCTCFYSETKPEKVNARMLETIWEIALSEIFVREALVNVGTHKIILSNSKIISSNELLNICEGKLSQVLASITGCGPVDNCNTTSTVSLDKGFGFKYHHLFDDILVQLFLLAKGIITGSSYCSIIIKLWSNKGINLMDISCKFDERHRLLFKKPGHRYLLIKKAYKKIFNKDLRRFMKKDEITFCFEI